MEIDFVVEKPDDKRYYQVTESLLGENVWEREFAPLRDIRDNYEKSVLSMDKSFIQTYAGIRQLNIIDFLMEARAADANESNLHSAKNPRIARAAAATESSHFSF